MLIGEYDYAMDMQEKQDEVREELEEVIAEAKAAEARAKKAAAEAKAEKAVAEAKAEKARAEKAAAEAKAEKAAAEAKAEKAAAENTKHLLGSLVQKGVLSVKDAAAEMGVSEDTFLKWIE